MKKIIIVASVLVISKSTFAASVNFTASATVVTAIAVSKTADLSFGQIAAGATAGTVTIDSADVRAVTGGVTAAGGTSSSANFSVSGAASTPYTITLPATANIVSGANTMAVAFSAAQVTGGALTRTLSAAGADSFKCGGTLTVAANQAAGAYTGTFAMNVNY